jgi:hypothetical protein
MKKLFIIILCLLLSFSLFLSGCTPEEKAQEKQNIEIYTLAYNGNITQAKEKAQEYYKDDKIKLETVINKVDSIAEFVDENDSAFPKKDAPTNNFTSKIQPKDDLIIQDQRDIKIKDGYVYINGSVTNQGNKTIEYYKITVKYLDENSKVIHSNFTNSTEKLYPNESREFKIMNKYNGYKSSQLVVEEIRFE